jgi:4-amino-4-deoxy-L-arabinose transferase-like glycosyltransferase
MEIKKLNRNPYLLFLPFLIFYIVIAFVFPTHGITGDENRYLKYAQNLLHGFYSDPPPNIDIGDGPGYPILIMPFLALGLPLICITVFNAILYYLSVILLYRVLLKVASFRLALICCLFWACYYNSFEYISLILPEIFTAFLIALLVFTLMKTFEPANFSSKKKYMYFSGFIIGYIALTKVIFGYVILCMLIGSILMWLIKRKNVNYRKSVFIFLLALLTALPYLIYTYHLTNRIFYWSTFGGINLYWMSTPIEGEYGSFVQYPINDEFKQTMIPGGKEAVESKHSQELQQIFKYKGLQRDDIYKKLAIRNIKSHPLKFIQNCISNLGRILFNYPYSYTYQKNTTLLRLPLNGIIVVVMLFCFIPLVINWRKLLFPIRFILFFSLLYIGGSVFGSAETRMFIVIVPMLLFLIVYTLQRSVYVKLKFENGGES